MGTGGYASGGASIAGTTATFLGLPYKGYRELEPWFEEFINAAAAALEIDEQRFITSTARARLLDPTYTPTYPAEAALATPTAAPTQSKNQDSMLDLLAAVALATYPLNQNFAISEKQGMVATGGNLQRRKGTRQALLKTAAAGCAQVVTGWTVPPYSFSLVLPDGLPSPGWGSWSPVTAVQAGTAATTATTPNVVGTGTAFTSQWVGYRIAIVSGATVLTDWVLSVTDTTHLTTVNNLASTVSGATFYISPGASFRPWIFEALRAVLSRFFPDWSQFGICYSQFRAGYSAAGESILPSGATLGRVANPHFDSWTAGVPTSWTKIGTGTLTQSPSVAQINYEFTSSAAQLDLTAAASGVGVSLGQSVFINNQLQHRVEVDYAYTNAQAVSVLTLQIVDQTNGQYWNPTTGAWQTAAYLIPLPVSTGAAVRARYATNVTMQANSSTTATLGTWLLSATVGATSDGTTSTKVVYTVYRCDILPMYSSAIEATAGGERTLWLPLVDQMGLTSSIGATSATMIEPANAKRSAYKLVTGTNAEFPYHAALGSRGFRSRTAWTNLIKGSNDFGADWVLTNATRTANSDISPIVGETVASAVRLTATNTGANISGDTGVAPTSKSYVGGVWVKKISADGVFSDVTLSLVTTSTTSVAYTLTQAQGWVLLPIRATFGGGDGANLKLKVAWGAASASGAIAIADAYLYDVTGQTGVLYPPVVRTGIGATASSGARGIKALTSTTDTNVLDPNLQRSMVMMTRGMVQLTVVPTLDAPSVQQAIFDFGQNATNNRIVLDIFSGTLRFRAIDNTPTTSTCSLTLTTNADPTSTQVTWQRDTKIVIRLRWSDNGVVSLSAGNSSASSTIPGSWVPVETSLAKIRVGIGVADLNNFDGIVTLIDDLQIGTPAT